MSIYNDIASAGISVIVCCYNSADRLPQTLKHLAQQVVPDDISWEIIIVNNASTDETKSVAFSEWQQYNLQQPDFKIVDQPKPGKIKALEKGIETSSYAFILICDDDNWLNSTYIKTGFNIMKSNGKIGVLGGNGQFEPELPARDFAVKHSNHYVNGPQTLADTQKWVYGAGSIIKKAPLQNLIAAGWDMITQGRVGSKLNGGEDVEICLAIHMLGYDISADGRLLFKHFVPLKRQNLTYLVNISYWSAYSTVLLTGYFHDVQQNCVPLNKVLNSWLCNTFINLTKLKVLLLLKTIKRTSLTDQDQLNRAGLSGAFNALIFEKNKIIKHHRQLPNVLKKLAN